MQRAFKPFALVLFAAILVGMLPLTLGTKKYTWFALTLLANQAPVMMAFTRPGRPSLAGQVHGPLRPVRHDEQSV
jgi:hypothetical protein